MPLSLVSAGLAAALSTTAVLGSQWWIDQYEIATLPQDGTGVVVAVIDTGVDASHPNLAGTLIGGKDFSGVGDDSGTLPIGPSYFHGTMVASVIAGQGISEQDVLGIAPGAKLLAASIGLGLDGADTDSQLADAIVWAVDNGADVINLSISRNSAKWPRSWDEAFLHAFENDVVIVAATGNQEQGKFATAPAVIPGVVAVTAIDAAASTESPAGSQGIGVTIAAPGVELLGSFPGGTTASWSGSSAAAPVVSGLLALMIQADPEARANDLIQRLITTATDAGEPGFDADFGFGIINPTAALASVERATENPLGSLANWVQLYRAEVSEDQAPLIVPSSPQPDNAVAEPVNSAPEPINPLLYVLLVPLALLPFVIMRKRFGR